MDEKRVFLRHALATVAYRANRTLENSSTEFAEFNGAGRKPVTILAHMGDLFDWALSKCQGQERWKVSNPLTWPEEQKRFFASVIALDLFLASEAPCHATLESILQGPVADALTHIGQLAMLRRMAGIPTKGENFAVAAIQAGQTDADQPKPVYAF